MTESSITTKVVCRPAVPDDAPLVAAVHDASRRKAYASMLTDAQLNNMTLDERTDYWHERIVAAGTNDFKVFVAEVDKAVCGFTCVESQRGGNRAEIDRLYVHPDFGGRGLGRALLNCAFDYVRDYGFEKVVLWTFEQNNPARAFYEKIGLKADGAERKWCGMPKEVRYAIKVEPW
jgi:ribosomal protein S18 acetylase RimI-like enzyme